MPEITVTYLVRVTKMQEVDSTATTPEKVEEAIIEDNMMEYQEAEFVKLEHFGE